MGLADRDYMRAPEEQPRAVGPRPTRRSYWPTFAAVAVSVAATLAFDATGVRVELPGWVRGGEVDRVVAGSRVWTADDVRELRNARAASAQAQRALVAEVRRAAALGIPLRVIRASTGLSRHEIFAMLRQ